MRLASQAEIVIKQKPRKVVIRQTMNSIHQDYIQFAINSYRDCGKSATGKARRRTWVDRNVIETIDYSVKAIEALVHHTFFLGLYKRLPIEPDLDSAASQEMIELWPNVRIALEPRIDQLADVWTNQKFWLNDKQRLLFRELKEARDDLTHPVPFGAEQTELVISEEATEDGVVGRTYLRKGSRAIRRSARRSNRGREVLSKVGKISQFESTPDKLGLDDAEKAVEIQLRHLHRMSELYFQGASTWVAYYDEDTKKALTPQELLNSFSLRRFENIWPI